MKDIAISTSRLPRRLLPVVCTVSLHLALLGVGAIAAAVVAGGARSSLPILPRQPLLGTLASFILAHCSVMAIWWARSALSPGIRTFVTAFVCGVLWLFLIRLLYSASLNDPSSATWAGSLLVQVAVVACAVTITELAMNYPAAAARNRFSVRFLFTCTTVTAVFLAIAGTLAGGYGWKLADVPDWKFFRQVQTAGLLNGLQAIAIYLSVRMPITWTSRAMVCMAVVPATTIAASAVLIAIFQDEVGALIPEVVWLFAAQGLFLVATLLPLEWASLRQPEHSNASKLHVDGPS